MCSIVTQKFSLWILKKMHVHYEKYGGWINTSTLSEQQKDRLTRSFSLFQSFDRHYKPEKHYTDQNFYRLRLSYEERTDTVTVYDPANASLPEELERLIADVENLHQFVFRQ